MEENRLLQEIAEVLDLSKDELIQELELLKIQDFQPDNLVEQLYKNKKIDTIIKKYNRMNALLWKCINCGTILNGQDGFKTNNGIWFCEKCNAKNKIDYDSWNKKNINR